MSLQEYLLFLRFSAVLLAAKAVEPTAPTPNLLPEPIYIRLGVGVAEDSASLDRVLDLLLAVVEIFVEVITNRVGLRLRFVILPRIQLFDQRLVD